MLNTGGVSSDMAFFGVPTCMLTTRGVHRDTAVFDVTSQ